MWIWECHSKTSILGGPNYFDIPLNWSFLKGESSPKLAKNRGPLGISLGTPNYVGKTAASRRNQRQRPSEGCLFQGYLGFQTRVLGLIRSAVGCFREVAKDWWRCEKRTEVWVVIFFFYPVFLNFHLFIFVGRWTRNWVLFFFFNYVFQIFHHPFFHLGERYQAILTDFMVSKGLGENHHLFEEIWAKWLVSRSRRESCVCSFLLVDGSFDPVN